MKLVFNRLFEDRDLSAEVNGRLAISVTRYLLANRLFSFLQTISTSSKACKLINLVASPEWLGNRSRLHVNL